MKKALALIKTGLKNSLVYRTDFFLWGFNEFLDTLVFLFIWLVIFGEKNVIGGFNLSETITYLIGVGLIANIIATSLIYDIERDIQSGWLSNLLNKPFSYPLSRFCYSFSGKPINLLIRTSIYFLVALLFKGKIVITSDLIILLLFIISIVLALFINVLLDFCLGCLAFWTTSNRGMAGIFQTFKSIFSGAYAPINFFPILFQTIAGFLPFYYTRYFPMLIYLRKISMLNIIKGIGIQIAWIIGLYFLAKFVWKKGIKKYEGVGI